VTVCHTMNFMMHLKDATSCCFHQRHHHGIHLKKPIRQIMFDKNPMTQVVLNTEVESHSVSPYVTPCLRHLERCHRRAPFQLSHGSTKRILLPQHHSPLQHPPSWSWHRVFPSNTTPLALINPSISLYLLLSILS
jgi:hypothetical protein